MKNVLITGGSGAIGGACAKLFSDNGYRVFATFNKNGCKIENVNALKCDVTDESSVKKIISEIDKSGGTDILINNAGVAQIKMLCDTTNDDYDSIFDVNMRGVYNVTKAAMKSMVHKKYGRIINISSVWGVCGASCEVLYSASKAAVGGFTKALSKELGPSGITVNCIAPGVIDTPMNKDIDKDVMDSLIDQTPVGRLGKPMDIAYTALFFAADNASFIQIEERDGKSVRLIGRFGKQREQELSRRL